MAEVSPRFSRGWRRISPSTRALARVDEIRRQDPRALAAGVPAIRIVGAHLGRSAAGQTRTRARAGACALAGSPLLLDRGSLGRLGLLFVGEDLLLGLALEQSDELVRLDRLALEQDPRERVELLAVLGEDVL